MRTQNIDFPKHGKIIESGKLAIFSRAKIKSISPDPLVNSSYLFTFQAPPPPPPPRTRKLAARALVITKHSGLRFSRALQTSRVLQIPMNAR